jgi:CRP-like cAMP-binding protein
MQTLRDYSVVGNTNILDIALHYGRCVEYHDDEIIHSRGDFSIGLSIVYSGQVKVGNYGIDGRYQLTAILEKGDTFGEFTLYANLPRTHNAEAIKHARVIQLNEAQYQTFISAHPEAEKMLLGSLANKLHQALENLDDVRRLPNYVRLAKILFNLCKQQQTQILNIKQNQCAQLLGVTVLSAHKALKQLKKEKLVKTAYGVIIIENVGVLQCWLQQHSSILAIDS